MTDLTSMDKPTLYRDGAFCHDDWHYLEVEEERNDLEKCFLPHAEALARLEAGDPLPDAFGVQIAPADDVEQLAPYLDRIAAVAISFPAFSDGRGFSSARLLRERHGYAGEIRAVGAYILDQMPFLLRCGVDSFSVTSDRVRKGLERGEWPEVDHYYQPTGASGEKPIDGRPWLRRKSAS